MQETVSACQNVTGAPQDRPRARVVERVLGRFSADTSQPSAGTGVVAFPPPLQTVGKGSMTFSHQVLVRGRQPCHGLRRSLGPWCRTQWLAATTTTGPVEVARPAHSTRRSSQVVALTSSTAIRDNNFLLQRMFGPPCNLFRKQEAVHQRGAQYTVRAPRCCRGAFLHQLFITISLVLSAMELVVVPSKLSQTGRATSHVTSRW